MRDQLDVTWIIIYLFNAQHVSEVNTSILRSLRLISWVISWVVLIWFDVRWCYVVVLLWWSCIRKQAEAQNYQDDTRSNKHRIKCLDFLGFKKTNTGQLCQIHVISSALTWAITQRIVAIPYPGISWLLNMGPRDCPEKSARDCYYTLSNISTGRRSLLVRGESLISRYLFHTSQIAILLGITQYIFSSKSL